MIHANYFKFMILIVSSMFFIAGCATFQVADMPSPADLAKINQGEATKINSTISNSTLNKTITSNNITTTLPQNKTLAPNSTAAFNETNKTVGNIK
jgi:hypothetical protein